MTEINYLEILKLCFLGGNGGCSSCPFKNEGFPKCLNIVYKGIEDTINRQKAEIERLKSPCEMQIEVSKKLEATIKAEAVKECIEKIKTRSSSCVASKDGIVIAGSRTYTISEVELYKIVKEMVGAESGK